ncbi:hypothetical protein BJ170DRAFT_587879 [Xylariales sp. AK1849]|nr:hypothetical protein BJ170DRAFT_587879 [Xylariales sp. AK1849]
MLSSSVVETPERSDEADPPKSNARAGGRQSRKKRQRLSCRECRKKKLSCDRNLPCQRCVKSGRPEQCSFEMVTALPSVLNPHNQHEQRNGDQIRDLQAEVSQLKVLLSKVDFMAARKCDAGNSHAIDNVQAASPYLEKDKHQEAVASANVNNTELSDPKERSPRGYYSRHTMFQFFGEIRELFPFIRETADEWFKPLGVRVTKSKSSSNPRHANAGPRVEVDLESLLPPQNDTEALVFNYLDHLEQVHRVVHVPSFRRQFANFWDPERTRHPAMTALVLAMTSISVCASPGPADATSIPIRYRAMPEQWISACDEWLRQQSPKHRKLVYHQISCLVYLARRVNLIGKKGFWKETGSLVQDAIMDGLHCNPPLSTDGPYVTEMKRRIWAVIRELDLQNALTYGLPTLLYSVDADVAPPANLEDGDFDETSKELPTPKPPTTYTSTSYQTHSSRSWALRLEVCRHLNARSAKALCYDDVLRYTQDLTQAIDALPSWETEGAAEANSPRLSTLTTAFLQFQLQECIIALHRPYLRKSNRRFSLSETVCYHTSRDVLLLNNKLAGLGLRTLTVLRDDVFLASLNLAHVTMLQPRGSTSTILADSQSTINLLEQCLPFMKDRYLRCCHGEPWCFITTCAAIMLLKIQMGNESRQTAKASCARQFLDLHFKLWGEQQNSLSNQDPTSSVHTGHANISASQLIPSVAPDFPPLGWLDSSYPELGFDSFDLDMNVDGTWDMWES